MSSAPAASAHASTASSSGSADTKSQSGGPADLTILAPDQQTVVDATRFRTKSRNTPFDGWKLRGAVACTIVGGRAVYVNDEVADAERFAAARQATGQGVTT